MQDYISVYDGRTSASAELARVCGGDSLPDIISSGSDMLIEFRTSPYDSLFHPVPTAFLLGFEMQIEVRVCFATLLQTGPQRERGVGAGWCSEWRVGGWFNACVAIFIHVPLC